MRIAIVYDMVYPFNIGGAEIRNHELAVRLAKNHEVHVYGVKLWEGPDVIKKDGLTIHGVCRYKELYTFSGKRAIIEPIVFALRLFKPLARERFDIIDASAFPYFHCFTCRLVSVLKKTPLVLTWHQYWGDYWYSYLGLAKGFFGKIIEKAVLLSSPNNIAVSHNTKKDLRSAGARKDVFVNYNGVDFCKINNASPSDERFDVVFAGRLVHQKNVSLLVKAIGILKEGYPKVRACIVGDGPDRRELESLARELGIEKNIVFTGFLEKTEEVYSVMKSSKVFVLPSVLEGFGIVVVEAKACGLPAIVVESKWNASVELLGDDGIVVKDDPQEMAQAIKKLLSDDSLRRMMGQRAKKNAWQYDWNIISKGLENYYYEVAKCKQG